MKEEQARSVAIVGGFGVILGFAALLAIVSTVVSPDSIYEGLFHFIFGTIAVFTIIIGPLLGIVKFYKKYVEEDELQTHKDIGIVITTIGGIAALTSGILAGGTTGELLLIIGLIVIILSGIAAIGKIAYRIA